jgi:hypothetical protein
MQRFRQTGNVTDRPRAGRRARQRPFSTAGALRGNLAFGGHISTRTVIRRLHHQGMRARRPIKRPRNGELRLERAHCHGICGLSDYHQERSNPTYSQRKNNTAILQEWQKFPQERLRRLVRSMTRRVTEHHNKRGGYTRY